MNITDFVYMELIIVISKVAMALGMGLTGAFVMALIHKYQRNSLDENDVGTSDDQEQVFNDNGSDSSDYSSVESLRSSPSRSYSNSYPYIGVLSSDSGSSSISDSGGGGGCD